MIKLSGFKNMVLKLDKIQKRADQRLLLSAVMAGGKVIARRAMELVPKRTRRLMRSISVVKDPSVGKDQAGVLIGPVRRKAWYGHIVEFGSVKQAPQPFLRPAFEEKKEEALKKAAEELEKVLE